MIFFRERSPVHSTRVGHEVEVYYRWHALFGQRVHQHYSEVRAGIRVSYVELSPGVVIVMPSWMLNPAACADLTFGNPRVDVAALNDLGKLLNEHGVHMITQKARKSSKILKNVALHEFAIYALGSNNINALYEATPLQL